MRSAAYIGKLTNAGMDTRLAQIHGEALQEILVDEFVTKEHFDGRVRELETKVDGRFKELEQKIEAQLQSLKADIIKWSIGQTFAVAALVFAVARPVK